MSLGLILDTSALLAHVRLERLSAGELISEVGENGDVTGIPALAVLDALRRLEGEDRIRLERLVNSDSRVVAVLPLLAGDLVEVDRIDSLIPGGPGGPGAAQAILEANRHGILLATIRPDDLGTGVVIHADDVHELS